MSVFTTVSPEQLSAWLKNYSIGVLVDLQGILSGIENTNYFVNTSHGKFVLTLFEKLAPAELPFYLDLMAHLSNHGIPCPKPIANLGNAFLSELNGKPATIVTFLEGAPVLDPGPAHCARVGEVLAEMHMAGRTYRGVLENLRGAKWWTACAPEIYPFLSAEDAELLRSEIAFQRQHQHDKLPRGVIHADLFRDNVLIVPNGAGESIGGLIDFYFAGCSIWLFDLAVTMNDWCIDIATGAFDVPRAQALIDAYHAVRPLSEEEHESWRTVLRAAALRFWISRLYDYYLPRPAEVLTPHDPTHFERILEHRISDATLPWVTPAA
jgi:homoserine kinase type II